MSRMNTTCQWEWFVNNMGVVREWRVTYRSNPMSIVVKRFNCATSFVLQNVLYMCATSNSHFHCIHLWQDWHSTSLITCVVITSNNHFHCIHSWHIVGTLHHSSSCDSFVPPHSFHRAFFMCATSKNHSHVIHVCHIVDDMLFTNHSHVNHEPLPCYSRTTPMLFTNHSHVIHVCHIVATLCQSFSNDSFVPPHSFYRTSYICTTSNNHPHVIYL